jgi:hypothetical protein
MQTRNSKRSRSWIVCISSRFRSRCCSQNNVFCDSRSFRIFDTLYWLEIVVRLSNKIRHDAEEAFHDKRHESSTIIRATKDHRNKKWIHEINNSIDSMIKSKAFSILKTLIDINTINMNINEWIERSINKIDI